MSGSAWVGYSQIYVVSGEDSPDLAECFSGQRNGLCGGALPGVLWLVTGLHSGEVGFAVELHDAPPPVDDSWEEIVEVSFRPVGEAALVSWGGMGRWPLDLALAGYRVRYCGTGMELGRDLDARMDEDPEANRYLLQFWPGPPEPDRVIRQTSEIAAYWHAYARGLPPAPTPAERAEAERLARLRQEQEAAAAVQMVEAQQWGGRPPGERLRQLRGNAMSLARLNRPLVDAVAEADPVTQREIARWVTRRAFAEAQLADVGWIAPALAAMDRGAPLPPPFDDDRRSWDLLLSDERVPQTLVVPLGGMPDNCSQQAMAFPAIFSAREPDPLRAAIDALWSAATAFASAGTMCSSPKCGAPSPPLPHAKSVPLACGPVGPFSLVLRLAGPRRGDRGRRQARGFDGVFVNAGIDGQGVPAAELELAHFRRVLDVNVLGVFAVARAVLPRAGPTPSRCLA